MSDTDFVDIEFIARKYRIACDGFVNCSIDDWNSVLTCIDGYVSDLDEKDQQIKKLTEALERAVKLLELPDEDYDLSHCKEVDGFRDLLAEIKE